MDGPAPGGGSPQLEYAGGNAPCNYVRRGDCPHELLARHTKHSRPCSNRLPEPHLASAIIVCIYPPEAGG